MSRRHQARPRRDRGARGCVAPTDLRRGHRRGGARHAARRPDRARPTPRYRDGHPRPGTPRAGASRPRRSHRHSPTGWAPVRSGLRSRRPGRAARPDSGAPQVGELGQVVTSQPELARVTGVEEEHDDATSDAPHLAQPGDRVLPMMNGAHRHRGVEGLVVERQVLRGSGQARRRVREVAANASARTVRPRGPGGRKVRRNRCRHRHSGRSGHRRAPPRSAPRCGVRCAGSRCRWLRWSRTAACRTWSQASDRGSGLRCTRASRRL